VLVKKIHQLYWEWIAVGGFLGKAFRSWLVIRTTTSQLVDFLEKHFAIGAFLLRGIEGTYAMGLAQQGFSTEKGHRRLESASFLCAQLAIKDSTFFQDGMFKTSCSCYHLDVSE